jgi:sulfide:quinone oxidoreductase
VEGLDGIYAVGDAGSFAVKQGGIACQQADAAASLVAIGAGAGIEPVPFDPVLRGIVQKSEGRLFLRSELAGGRDESAGVASHHDPLWWPPEKVAGRFLAPFLAGLDPGHELLDQPAAPPGSAA